MYEIISRKEYHEILTSIVSVLKQQIPMDVDFSTDYQIGFIDGLLKIDEQLGMDDSIVYYILHRIGDYDDPTPVLPVRTTQEDFFNEVWRNELLIDELDDLLGGMPNISPYTMSDLEDNELVSVQNRHERMSIYQ